uniref:Uncharacterized protein n=1 Tax=Cannabis sativa TaxID=3483 RepID=A0A803PHT9_CANSA
MLSGLDHNIPIFASDYPLEELNGRVLDELEKPSWEESEDAPDERGKGIRDEPREEIQFGNRIFILMRINKNDEDIIVRREAFEDGSNILFHSEWMTNISKAINWRYDKEEVIID